ncbi:hypothetical protein GJ744_006744 [Endocarpon pusillum]|uniref:Uncharacterized protein n=1 Tax=Endocarpon pusillum TaxID=364733 RepID=A0A8H7A448_9EURO|nr:hypothetical protein GJ744_006744 [Endocarpon pusillum]
MPSTTRSKATKISNSTSAPEEFKRKSSTAGARRAKETSQLLSSPRASAQQLPVPRSRKAKEPSHLASALSEVSTRVLPENAIVHWPCRTCSCPQGVFTPPIDVCMFCEHDMDDHEIDDIAWDPNVCHLSHREELVAATLRLVLEKGLVVIRATPQVGKTTLLVLLGRHILYNHRSLEPIWMQWRRKEDRNGLNYTKYLEEEAKPWREMNAQYRPSHPNPKKIYLIDEAQNSYPDVDFWTRVLKNRYTRSRSLFVLVCVYGSTTDSLTRFTGRDQNIQSEAIMIDQSQRIDLRPSVKGGLCMQFTSKETEDVVQKWAHDSNFKLMGNVGGYMHTATSGHPGMLSMFLMSFDSCFPQLNSKVRFSRIWTPELCHTIITNQVSYLDVLERCGRGFWTRGAENFCLHALRREEYANIKWVDVIKAMSEAAVQPDGYTHLQTEFDAFAFCHKMGFLHTEPLDGKDDGKIKYVFASPVHRRVAHRRLFPGPDPDAAPDGRTLLQVCLNAIEGISPSTLQERSNARWSIPEAAFQDEMYRCLHRELHHIPILSEYSHSSSGRVDFYVFDKKWGIEILQSGSKAQIMEHAARFGLGGKYTTWNILDDYIVLNFCPKTKLRNLEVQDTQLKSHIMQIVIDPHARIAEVYTYDMQLKDSFTLGEGRCGSGTGAHNLGMSNEESNGSTPDSGHAYGKLDLELLQRGERDSRRQVLQMTLEQILQIPEEERAIILSYMAEG